MEIASYDEIKVDRCTGCKGLWFQPEELAALRNDIWMADYILDQGTPRSAGNSTTSARFIVHNVIPT